MIWLFIFTLENAAQKIISFSLHRHSNSLTHTGNARNSFHMHTNHQIYFPGFFSHSLDFLAQSFRLTNYLCACCCINNRSKFVDDIKFFLCFRVQFYKNRMSNVEHTAFGCMWHCDSCHAYHDAFETLNPNPRICQNSRSRFISHPNSPFYLWRSILVLWFLCVPVLFCYSHFGLFSCCLVFVRLSSGKRSAA